jgi:type I restriction enzyme S subunit|tara:strand:- start:174 stop:1487 length:1314 start_codon:yes stop_codon:yes gene_type:complete
MLSNAWKYIPGDEFCLKVTDGTHDSPKQSEHGKPLITSKHIKGDEIDFSTAYLISEQDFHEINKRSKVDQWDVIISMIGAYCGFCFIECNEEIDYAVKNVGLFKAGSEVNAKWLYYYLNSSIGRAHLDAAKSGSTQPYIALGALRNLPILVPTNNDVKKNIVGILDAIDSKIRVNNRINAELEAMAKTLYDYWFVQFDFPNANGKPYKTSGGKMVYNPTLKREIPEGWELVPIEYFADVIDPHPSHRAPREVEIGFPFAGIGDIDEAGNISTSKARQIDEEFVLKQERDYEIGEYSLGYGRVGTVGKVVRLKKQKFRYALSPTLSVINPKKPEYAGYVYTVVKSDEFYKHVIKNTSGTTRPAVGIQLLRKIPVLKPGSAHNNMFEKYEEITKELFEKSSIANQENQNLIELRDWLLPMLMNGQVTVNSVTQPTAKEA